MKRALLLAILLAGDASAGEFPVCYRGAQYARIELVNAFAPTQCVAEQLEANPMFGVLAVLGLVSGMMIYGACTRYAAGSDTSRIVFDMKVETEGANEALGHELRHAFEPREFHPPMLPMVSSSCE